MARKKKSEASDASSGYDVLIGFVKEFTYSNEQSIDQMNGHPFTGRVYRIIKDSTGYRLHIGRENNNVGLDGLFLGKTLKGDRPDFSFDVEIITPENFFDLTLTQEDLELITKWQDSKSQDLWAHLEKEMNGSVPVIRTIDDIIKLVKQRQELEATKEEDYDESPVDYDPEHYATAHRISMALTKIASKDHDFVKIIGDVLDYLASTYGDKYEGGEMPNIGKIIVTQTPDLGKGANVFNMIKYTQRYATKGFKKSENIEDIYKVIHYALFELQRRNHNSK
jgi:hypothetical protein